MAPASGIGQNWLQTEENIKHAYVLLRSYREHGTQSRTFGIPQLDEMLTQVNAGTGHYADYTEQQRQFVRCCLYADLLQRLCLVIEDYARLSYALWESLEQFPERIARQDLEPGTMLTGITHDRLRVLLRQIDPNEIPTLAPGDRSALKNIQDRNRDALLKFSSELRRFQTLYQPIYNRIKHSNSLIFGLERLSVDDKLYTVLPTPTRESQPTVMKGLLIDDDTIDGWKRLFNAVISITNDFLDRAIEVIERNGTLLSERSLYFPLARTKKEAVKAACTAFESQSTRTVPAETKIAIEFSRADLKKFDQKFGAAQRTLVGRLRDMGF